MTHAMDAAVLVDHRHGIRGRPHLTGASGVEPGKADGAQEPGIQRCVCRDGLLVNPDWFDDDVLERRVLRQTVGAS